MKKVLSFLIVFFVVSISFLGFVAPPANAVLNPSYSGSRDSTNGNLTLSFTEPDGTDFATTKTFRIPAGFDVAAGTSFAQDTILGSGTFTGVISGTTSTVSFTVFNDLDLQSHKAHWKFNFASGAVIIDSFVDGSVSTGYTFTVISPEAPTITTPTSANFTLFGTVNGIPLYTLPSIGGEYFFGLDFTSAAGETLSRSFIINLPSLTPSGSDVTTQFNGGISVTYNRVTGQGGETTITSSTSPPAAGTGEFEIGGVYYDFNTTASIRCPCTITLPYDPAVTPDPKIYHLESGVWVDVTTSFDSVNHTVTGVVSSFSFFVIGEPNHTAEWLSPVKAFEEQKDQPFDLNENQALPLNLIVRDSNGTLIQPNGLIVELRKVTDTTTSTLITSASPVLNEEGDHLKAKINFKDLGSLITPGEYFLRVIINGTNTTLTPDVHFTIS